MTRMQVEHRLFGGGWSQPLQRELFERGDAVGVLLYDPHNHLVGLVEQFRPGALNESSGPWQYEVVAGMLKPGESPEQVAIRELQEEADLEVAKLIPICDYLVSAGGTRRKNAAVLWSCGSPRARGGIYGVDGEGEDILLHVWSYAETHGGVFAGPPQQRGHVQSHMLWLQLNHQQLRRES